MKSGTVTGLQEETPALSSLIEKFVYSADDDSEAIYLEEDLIEDEEFSPSQLAELFTNEQIGNDAQMSLSHNDLQAIQDLVDFDAADLKTSRFIEFDNEFNEDLTEKRFNQIILELMSSETPSAAEYQFFVDTVKHQAQQLLWIGQYEQILDILKVLENNKALRRFTDINAKAVEYYHSSEFMAQLVDSLKLLGKHMRKEVWMICEYYDKALIPFFNGCSHHRRVSKYQTIPYGSIETIREQDNSGCNKTAG